MRESIFHLTYRPFVAHSVIKHRYNIAYYFFITIITFSPCSYFFLFCTFSWFLTALCFLSSFLFVSARHRLRSGVHLIGRDILPASKWGCRLKIRIVSTSDHPLQRCICDADACWMPQNRGHVQFRHFAIQRATLEAGKEDHTRPL